MGVGRGCAGENGEGVRGMGAAEGAWDWEGRGRRGAPIMGAGWPDTCIIVMERGILAPGMAGGALRGGGGGGGGS